MKKILLIINLILFCSILQAQSDTIAPVVDANVEIYDVVAVHKQGTDGRGRVRHYVSEIKGEIINYDETTGVLTFKGLDGRMFSFQSEDYKYFEYNKEFVKKNKQKGINPRKEDEFEISAGFRTTFINFNDNFSASDYYLNSNGGTTDLPIALFVSAGKYFGRTHYLGINGEIALYSYGQNYLSAGLRYCYQYDAHKSNVAYYLPVELNFFKSNYSQSFQVNDTTFYDGGNSFSYPSDEDLELSISATSLSLGQGFSFIMKNKNAVAVEIALIKYFPFNATYTAIQESPNVQFAGSGMRLSVTLNL